MMSYKLVTYYKDGSKKFEVFPYKDFRNALRKLHRLSRHCELWYVVDDVDYRLVESNYSCEVE